MMMVLFQRTSENVVEVEIVQATRLSIVLMVVALKITKTDATGPPVSSNGIRIV